MTIEELADELGIGVNYLYQHWKRIKEDYYLKRKIVLEKKGRGVASDYGVKYPEDKDIRWIPLRKEKEKIETSEENTEKMIDNNIPAVEDTVIKSNDKIYYEGEDDVQEFIIEEISDIEEKIREIEKQVISNTKLLKLLWCKMNEKKW